MNLSSFELVASLFKIYFGYGLRDRIKQIESTSKNPDVMKILYGKAYEKNQLYGEALDEFTAYWFKGFKERGVDPYEWFLFFVKDAKTFLKPILKLAPERDKMFIQKRISLIDNSFENLSEVTVPQIKLTVAEWGGLEKKANGIPKHDLTDDLNFNF